MTLFSAKRMLVLAFATVLGFVLVSAAPAAANERGTLSSHVSLRVVLPAPDEIVTGAALNLQVYARGYKLDARYSGRPDSSRIGHYHEILDGNHVDMTPPAQSQFRHCEHGRRGAWTAHANPGTSQ